MGRRRTQRSGNDEAAVGMCGVIRVICVIRLIRDSDTAERMGTHGPLGNEVLSQCDFGLLLFFG